MMLRAIARSCIQSLKGQEKLGIVFWRWGVLLYISSILIGIAVIAVEESRGTWFALFVGILGAVLLFIYPFMFCFSLWRCSKNTMRTWCKYAARAYAVAFIPAIHIWVGGAIALGSMVLIGH